MMLYPESPFNSNFNVNLLFRSGCDISEAIQNENRIILKWLCSSPKVTTYRVNTLKCTIKEVLYLLKNELTKFLVGRKCDEFPKIELISTVPDVIVLHNVDLQCMELEQQEKEVIVDVNCGASILRGAHIYAPGVIGMISGVKREDKVSIFVDLPGKCKKGLHKLYESDHKVFIGNGIAKMVRYELFGENLKPTGIAVQVTDTISGCPNFGDEFIPKGFGLLQNFPSIVCVHALNPHPGDVVLDMCAAPGNKTTHIAALMQNKGQLVAIDKHKNKVEQLKLKCLNFDANALIFQANSTKLFDESIVAPVHNLEQCLYPGEYFDKVLLDAPCSALGKRPQFSTNISEKILKSYVPLQRKLFTNAVHLLKPNGTLVYSTCTITTAENEDMVAWALKKFSCLELKKAEPYYSGSSFIESSLNSLQQSYVQRFGPEQNIDSVGFFIACFIKKDKS